MKFSILFILTILLFSNHNPSHAQTLEPSFDFDAKEAIEWIDMVEDQNYSITLPISINGKIYNALIDTGSTGPILFSISEKVRKEMGFPILSEETLGAYGGKIVSDVVNIPSIKVGGVTLGNAPAYVIQGEIDDNIDIVIRQNFLHSFALQVDWGKRQLRFLLTGDSPDTIDQIPVVYDDDTWHIYLPVQLCGSASQFILDTGQENPASVNDQFVPIENCSGSLKSTLSATGFGGRVINPIIALPSIALGDVIFDDIIAAIIDPNGIVGDKNGVIGFGIMNRSNFILDIGAGKLQFYGDIAPQTVPANPTMGILVETLPDRFKIVHIMANSPASNRKLDIGDEICKVDDQTIGEFTAQDWTLNPEAGTILSIELCEGNIIEITAATFLKNDFSQKKNDRLSDIDLNIVGAATKALHDCGNWVTEDTAIIRNCASVIDSPEIPEYYKHIARLNRAQLLANNDRHIDAIADLNLFIAGNEAHEAVLTLRAVSAAQLKQYELAAADIESALILNPNYDPAYIALAMLEYNKGQWRQSFNAIEQALAINSENADAFVWRGKINEKRGNWIASRKDYERALEIDADNIEAVNGLQRLSDKPKA